MFSGLIRFQGRVAASRAATDGGLRLVVRCAEAIADGVALGDSIAVNGACLTVVEITDDAFAFDIVPETMRRSTLGTLQIDERVNLELSLRLGDRLGGHLVYAHVDATIRIIEKRAEGQGWLVTFALPERYAAFVAEKGYVCLDGVSLTVASREGDAFSIAMIPETARATTLGEREAGAVVNFEADPIARYAAEAAARYHAGEPKG